jgi:hypothetical protein
VTEKLPLTGLNYIFGQIWRKQKMHHLSSSIRLPNYKQKRLQTSPPLEKRVYSALNLA